MVVTELVISSSDNGRLLVVVSWSETCVPTSMNDSNFLLVIVNLVDNKDLASE